MPDEVIKEDEKSFDDYFDEAVAEEEGTIAEPVVEPVVEPIPDESAEVKVDDVVADPVIDPTVDDPVVDPKADPVVPPEEEVNWEERYNTAMADNQRLEHKMSSWEGRIKKANDAAALAVAEVAELKKEPVKTDTPLLEDDEMLKEFKEEFPDLVEPMQRMAKKIAESIVNERLGSVTPQIEALKVKQEQTDEQRFLAPIADAHPDWRKIYDSGKLQVWIDKHTPLQQRVYNEIVNKGSQEEVIDMFTTYKEATVSKDKPNTGDVVDPSVQGIVAVQHQSAGPPAAEPDKSDFEKGWEEATSG